MLLIIKSNTDLFRERDGGALKRLKIEMRTNEATDIEGWAVLFI